MNCWIFVLRPFEQVDAAVLSDPLKYLTLSLVIGA